MKIAIALTYPNSSRAVHETYYVDPDSGAIQRIGRNSFGPSGRWTLTGIVRRNNAGGVAERIALKDIPARVRAGMDWTFKNGKPRWTGQDIDHGTAREWGSPMIHSIFLVDAVPAAAA